MITPFIRRVGLLATVALLVAACGGGSESSGGDDEAPSDTTAVEAVEITVRTSEFTFDPVDLQVPADTPFTLVLVNDGVVEHDFTIDEAGVVVLAQPGETVRQTITLSAGTYHVHCSVPGHREAGMEGTLTAG
ncbi:MAG: cupredoxin domain-containing protein [Acidimicrobiia bacterium]